MNHKRGVPKARRSGCLMCKPHKLGKGAENDTRFKPYRDELAARREQRDYDRDEDLWDQWIDGWDDDRLVA